MDTLEEFYNSARKFDLVTNEWGIASWTRGYVKPQFSEWLDAENTALRILLDLATHDPLELYAADGKEDLLVNILARALGNSHHETTYQTEYLATLSALTFAGAGNFPSASIFAKQARGNSEAGEAERWMMSFLANPRSGLSTASPPALFRRYAQLQDTALREGHTDDFDRAHEELHSACGRAADELGISDRYLVLLWQHVHERLCELSVARILREIGFPHQGYSAVLVQTTSPLFYPPQAQILQDRALIEPGENVLVSLPTSTGKSLIGEIALVASLRWKPMERWLAVYIAPYRALADQLHERMGRRLRNREVSIACIKRRGNYLTDMSSIKQRLPTIMIATPESFDALLRQDPNLSSCLSACVFDEFHLIEQHQRGLRYEGTLGRFLHGAAGNGWPKIVALSAVVTDVEDVKRWLRIDEASFFHSAWKPTARRIAVTSPSGRVEYFPLGEQIPNTPASEPAWQGQISLPYQIDTAPARPVSKYEFARYRQAIELLDHQVRSNVAGVALDQYERFHEPVLILASSRTDTRLIASLVKNGFDQRAPDSPAYNLALELEQRCPHLFTLRECLGYGVAYHNASLPDWVRRRIEELISRKELDVVAATTTLAEGVDMPFRVVVMADWRSWLFGQKRPMPTLLFHNIAGRCGRAWEFSEGDTLIVDNPGREPTYFPDRYRDYVTRYVDPEPFPLYSSVKWSIDSQDSDIVADTQAVLESQFAAYLAACGGTEGVEERYVHSLYAGQELASADYVEKATNAFVRDMLAEQNYPVLVQHSPLELTDFGEVVLVTGLSPRSGVRLAYFLDAFEAKDQPSKDIRIRARHGVTWEPVLYDIWEQIEASHTESEQVEEDTWVRELDGYRLKNQIRGQRHPVTGSNFPMVLMAWVSGVPIEVMAYLTLRGRNQKELLQSAEQWLQGESTHPSLDLEQWIERLAEFCDGYLGHQWAWVCRGAALIGSDTSHDDLAQELARLAGQLGFGVSQVEAQEFLASGCPLDRAKVDWAIREYKNSTNQQQLDLESFSEWLRDETEHLLKTPIGFFGTVRVSERDIRELAQFVQVHRRRGPSRTSNLYHH